MNYHHFSRVSFHSVKDSSSAGAPGTGVSSDQDHDNRDDRDDRDDRDLTSSSLPTPPPPPLQDIISYL